MTTPPSSDPAPAQSTPLPRPFFVGIGSSAGGLEALTMLMPGLPLGLGLRYVVVQHMSPTHRSMMSHLLGRTTAMEVLDVTNGCTPLPDKVYVTPPNNNVVIAEDGTLQLIEPPNETVPKPSVNLFFNSLAEVVGDRAIGVILSGTGSDGAVGLHAIKAAGGYSFAQEPGGAKYDGMVRSAIEAGGVDWVLPAESMGNEIRRIVQRQHVSDGFGGPVSDMPPATLQALLHGLYAQTRIDFTGYKEATLLRRIDRRMTSTGCHTLDQYVEFARHNPKELHTLSQDMLISVTSFFRDRGAFDRLREEVGRLLEKKPAGEEIRAWVAGCASGEEAFSLAILIRDAVSRESTPRRVQIFASDIDEAALLRARRGVYPASVMTDLEPTTLDQHFTPHADGYEASKALRSMVMFARHNMVQDPPFVRLDMISCRNVLIYMQAPLQDRLMRTFQYALNPGGLLFLGRSEGMHQLESSFEVVDRPSHLYRRGLSAQRPPLPGGDRDRPAGRQRPAKVSLDELVLRATAERFAPASVLLDEGGDIRHFKGDLEGIMSLPDGRPGFQIMSLLRRELRPELARLIRSAREGATATPRNPSARGQAPIPAQGRWRVNQAISTEWALRMSVQTLIGDANTPLLLVCFERRPALELAAPQATEADEAQGSASSALEEELATTREHLYTLIEELETSNEEAQSLNEEIQTANEELQSTNEELEASNEELQASNEELTTVNEELQVKSLEWQALNAELEGIYATVDFPLLAFDEHFLLTRMNSAVQRELGMEKNWLGKPVQTLPWPTGMPPLQQEMERVQVQGQSLAMQLLNVGARHWSLRIMPRVGADGSRSGVLVQMEDNTRLRDSEIAAMRSDAQLRQLVERSAQLVCICSPSGRLQMANPEFERCHGLAPGSATGRLVTELLPGARGKAIRDAQIEAMRRLALIEAEEAVQVDGERRDLLASYYPLLDEDGAASGVCYQALDITRRNQAESALLAANSAKLAAEGIARTKSSFLANMSHEIRTPMNAVLGLSRIVLEGDLPPIARGHVSKVHEAAQALTRILDDVLDFSKIEAGEMRFEERPFRLDDELRSVKSLFSATAEQKGLNLALDLPLGVPLELVGDSLRLSQVLNNLVGNALKFTEHGEVRISVSPLEPSQQGWCSLRFAVRDTGIGISPEAREKLFEAFSQADESVTRRFGGTGLGLTICRKLVHLMNGQIGVNSDLGHGSEFWFSASFAIAKRRGDGLKLNDSSTVLPSVATPPPRVLDAAPAAATTSSASPVSTPVAAAPAHRVVLAEDNLLNQIVGRSVLEKMGLEVFVANDGQEAVDLIGSQPIGHFKAVLMDMHMPVLDGLAATRILRTLPQGSGLPIIAVTAAAMSEDRELCLAAGMDAHIAKPLVPEHLMRELASILNPAGKRPSLGAPASAIPKVTGFDLQPLFERLRGDEAMVWSLLDEFIAREGDAASDLQRLIDTQRLDEARIRAHTLSGSAATLGATLVARTTSGLEAALAAGLASPAMLQSVHEALDASVAAASAALQARTH